MCRAINEGDWNRSSLMRTVHSRCIMFQQEWTCRDLNSAIATRSAFAASSSDSKWHSVLQRGRTPATEVVCDGDQQTIRAPFGTQDWSLNASSGIATLTCTVGRCGGACCSRGSGGLAQSMRLPQKVGMARMSNGLFPVWLYRGHLWLTCRSATAEGCSSERCEDQASLQRKGTVVVGVFRPEHPRSDGEHGPCHVGPEAAARPHVALA